MNSVTQLYGINVSETSLWNFKKIEVNLNSVTKRRILLLMDVSKFGVK